MNRFNLLIFFVWAVVGLTTILGGYLSMFNYVAMWITFMAYLFINLYNIGSN